MSNVEIMIPSQSRATAQKTIHHLSDRLWPYIKLVVPCEQYNEYRAHVPIDIEILPFGGPGIGLKREFMLRMGTRGKLIMFDDDLRFYKRVADGGFTQAAPIDTEQMVSDICALLDKYPHVGMVDKFMSQTKPRGHVECHRFNQVLCFNRDTLPRPWPTFRMMYAHEEHDLHLQLLTRGHKTAVTTEWTKTDVHNAKGGCSDWRNPELFKAEQVKILELWPDIVSVKDEKDVKYKWREARKIGGIL